MASFLHGLESHHDDGSLGDDDIPELAADLTGAGAALVGAKLSADILHGPVTADTPAIHLRCGDLVDGFGIDVGEQVGDFTVDDLAPPAAESPTPRRSSQPRPAQRARAQHTAMVSR